MKLCMLSAILLCYEIPPIFGDIVGNLGSGWKFRVKNLEYKDVYPDSRRKSKSIIKSRQVEYT